MQNIDINNLNATRCYRSLCYYLGPQLSSEYRVHVTQYLKCKSLFHADQHRESIRKLFDRAATTTNTKTESEKNQQNQKQEEKVMIDESFRERLYSLHGEFLSSVVSKEVVVEDEDAQTELMEQHLRELLGNDKNVELKNAVENQTTTTTTATKTLNFPQRRRQREVLSYHSNITSDTAASTSNNSHGNNNGISTIDGTSLSEFVASTCDILGVDHFYSGDDDVDDESNDKKKKKKNSSSNKNLSANPREELFLQMISVASSSSSNTNKSKEKEIQNEFDFKKCLDSQRFWCDVTNAVDDVVKQLIHDFILRKLKSKRGF